MICLRYVDFMKNGPNEMNDIKSKNNRHILQVVGGKLELKSINDNKKELLILTFQKIRSRLKNS